MSGSYLVSGSLSVKDQEVDTIGGFFTPGAAGAFRGKDLKKM